MDLAVSQRVCSAMPSIPAMLAISAMPACEDGHAFYGLTKLPDLRVKAHDAV